MKRASCFTQMSPLLTKAITSGLCGHIVAFSRAPHVFVFISYGNNGPGEDVIDDLKRSNKKIVIQSDSSPRFGTKSQVCWPSYCSPIGNVTCMTSGRVCTEEERAACWENDSARSWVQVVACDAPACAPRVRKFQICIKEKSFLLLPLPQELLLLADRARDHLQP